MKFKAAVLTELNHPLIVSDIELTSKLKFGQVLVKINKSGICGAQLQEINGDKGNAKFLPHLMGHEGSGIVIDVGLGVSKFKIGDKVVMHWRKGSGIESDFPTYQFENKTITSGKVTTLSEFSVVSENRLTKVPMETPDELCALLGCGLTTALGTINNEAQLKFGENIMIIGCGGVGLNLIQGAKLASAYEIVGLDLNEEKKNLAVSLGASEFISASNENEMNDFLKSRKFDVIIDTTGNNKVIENSINYLNNSGRYILISQPKLGTNLSIPNSNTLFDGEGKTIKASQGGRTNPDVDIIRYINLYNKSILNIDKLVTHNFGLEDINKAFDFLKSGLAGRIMINLN